MRQFLLVPILITACAVQAQGPYLTGTSPNGLAWRTLSASERLLYVVGAMEGGKLAFKLALLNATAACASHVNAVQSKWIHSTPGELVREVDASYESAADIPVPAIGAMVYSLMKLGGASKIELEQYRKALRTEAVN